MCAGLDVFLECRHQRLRDLFQRLVLLTDQFRRPLETGFVLVRPDALIELLHETFPFRRELPGDGVRFGRQVRLHRHVPPGQRRVEAVVGECGDQLIEFGAGLFQIFEVQPQVAVVTGIVARRVLAVAHRLYGQVLLIEMHPAGELNQHVVTVLLVDHMQGIQRGGGKQRGQHGDCDNDLQFQRVEDFRQKDVLTVVGLRRRLCGPKYKESSFATIVCAAPPAARSEICRRRRIGVGHQWERACRVLNNMN